MPGRVILEVTAGPLRGQVHAFEEHDTFIFGRGEDCHARLSDKDVTASRHHFILEVNPPDARIRDLGSLNGTYVNGVRYGGRPGHMTPEEGRGLNHPEVDIHSGDEIKVGETAFNFHVEAAVAVREEAGRGIPSTRAVEPMHCNRCGKDVTAEVNTARAGAYTCKECLLDVEADPAQLLQTIVERTRNEGELVYGNYDRYERIEKIGEGGMGAVYLARRKDDGAHIALKVLLAKVAVEDYARKAFLREIDITGSLRHPNVVELFDRGSAENAFYFAMEYCPGGSVMDLMEERGAPLPPAEAASIMLQALEGLSYAHEREFVHRDLKPHNILLTAKRDGLAKLSDFGLAKNFQKAGFSGMTVTGTVGGTLAFMPREQLTNFKRVKPVGDVWSMAATFYYMLTRFTPRDLSPGQNPVDAVMRGEIVPIRRRDPGVPVGIAEVIDRALAKEPADRFPTAAELREALAEVL